MVSEVTITLDKERTLRFDFNAICAIERETGKNMLTVNVFKDITASDLVMLLWAALLHEDKTLTVDAVGAMIGMSDAGRMLNALTAAFGAAMPKAEKDSDPIQAPK